VDLLVAVVDDRQSEFDLAAEQAENVGLLAWM